GGIGRAGGAVSRARAPPPPRRARPNPRPRSSPRRCRLRATPWRPQTCRPRMGGGESLVRGRHPLPEERRETWDLGRALEPLFDPRSGNDVVAIAEAEGCLQRALLIPEAVRMPAPPLELGSRGRGVALRPGLPQLRPAL